MAKKAKANTASRPHLGSGPLETGVVKMTRTSRQREQIKGEVVYWEENNPRCVLNMVSGRVKELMRELPPEMLSLPFNVVHQRLAPSWSEEQIRLAFWDEYFVACDNGKSMRMSQAYAGVCSREMFYQYIQRPLFLAFMLQPPHDYMMKMRSLLDVGLERFSEVLRLPIVKNGTADTRLIGEIVKIVSLIDNRVKGSVAQRFEVDQRSMSMNMNVNQSAKSYEPPKDHVEIEEELRAIESEIKSLEGSSSSAASIFGERRVSDADVLEAEYASGEES